MIQFKDLDKTDILFTHFDDATGEQTTFNITKMTEYCKANVEVCQIPVTIPDALYIMKFRGIEDHRLQRLAEVKAEDVEPLILCGLVDSSFLLVDGSHRYIHLAITLQALFAKAYLLRPVEWEQFVVEGVPLLDPDKTLANQSGL